MKYIAVLDIDEIEDFAFFEDGKEKYLHGIDANSVNGEWIYLPFKPLEQEPILDKIKSDIAKFADTIPFVSGDIKAKYTNIGQHYGLEQALEIIEGNLKGDFDIDEWMAENEPQESEDKE